MNQLPHKHNVAILAGLLTLAVLVTIWGTLIWTPTKPAPIADQTNTAFQLAAPLINISDPARGTQNAATNIVEFGDFLCPRCAAIDSDLQKLLKQNPGIRLIWKDMPNTRLHPLAIEASIAARCAGNQHKFWEYHDALFKKQEEIVEPTIFTEIAQTLKLDTAAFAQCQTSDLIRQQVDLTTAEGIALGVDETPYFFIGTTRGALSIDAIESAITTQPKNPTTK
jgi:protein-disulfide isomerase